MRSRAVVLRHIIVLSYNFWKRMLLIFVISYLFFLIYFILFCLWHVPIIYAWVATTSYLVPVSDHVSSVTKFFRSFMKYIIYNSSHSIIGFWYWQVLYVIYYLLMFCWVPDPELYALILFLFIRILSIWLRITRLILSSNALFHVNCFPVRWEEVFLRYLLLCRTARFKNGFKRRLDYFYSDL